MVTRGRREEVIPSAARLLVSLRDLGYDFVNAVADLIDNSISAGSTRVDVTIASEGPDSWVRIADNGSGMDATAISEAMRLGSGRELYVKDDLGKFGLGLKTASLSQARSITVASRSHPTRRQIECRQLDLDEVITSDLWEIVHPAAEERPPQVSGPLQEGTGTVVLWTKLDRVLSLNDPFGGWADRHLLKLAERLDLHLGMVFGRFLSGQALGSEALTITVNGNKVDVWDPFCLDESTLYLPEKELQVGNSLVRYRPYVLPPQRDFSDDDAWRRASGPNQWNRQQGLYIYRGDRMIQSGGWSWLRGPDEHVKLARAALEFWPDLDEAFEINISKMRVRLPEGLRTQLKPLVAFLSKCADERYRKIPRKIVESPPAARPPSRATPKPPPAEPPSSEARIGPVEPPAPPPRVSDERDTDVRRPLEPAERRAALEVAAARAGAVDVLERIRVELHRTNREVARDLGW
jgi:Histidine kinase-, DNA gyrase B-, and HSP90-like ATPase